MHKLGDQWIEIIDGQEHMVKCVPLMSNLHCDGCCFQVFNSSQCSMQHACPTEYNTGIKDLGILNEDGCLPNCWGEYPRVKESCGGLYPMGGFAGKRHFLCIAEGTITCFTELFATKQEAIDAWNRRE